MSRFCPERDSFIFPPGAEVTLPCLSSTLMGGLATRRLASLSRTMIRLAVTSHELAFLSTLALLSPDQLSDAVLLPEQAVQLRQMELYVLRAFESYARNRRPAASGGPFLYNPSMICKQLALLADIRAIQQTVPLLTWLEPSGSTP